MQWLLIGWRGGYGEIFALFHACVGNFHSIRPWKVVRTLYLDSSYVTFKYFAFLSVCDKFELLGHVQAAMMIWVLFSPFFLDSLLVTVSGFIGLFWSSRYFNLASLQILGSTPALDYQLATCPTVTIFRFIEHFNIRSSFNVIKGDWEIYMEISYGSPRKWMSNFTKLHLTH